MPNICRHGQQVPCAREVVHPGWLTQELLWVIPHLDALPAPLPHGHDIQLEWAYLVMPLRTSHRLKGPVLQVPLLIRIRPLLLMSLLPGRKAQHPHYGPAPVTGRGLILQMVNNSAAPLVKPLPPLKLVRTLLH